MKINKYSVFWKHSKYKPSGHNCQLERLQTECFVELNNELHSYGVAKCYYKDRPNRKIALKQSLKKALNSLGKEERILIWNEFFKTHSKCLVC